MIFRAAAAAIVAVLTGAIVFGQAGAEENRFRFPEGFEKGVHYATVKRGNIVEELFTSQAAVDAAKAGQPLPAGTVITMTDTRDGMLYRYIVMEKGEGWGQDVSAESRTGDWQFQWFNPDKTVNSAANMARCQSCHVSQSGNDFVWTYDRMKSNP